MGAMRVKAPGGEDILAALAAEGVQILDKAATEGGDGGSRRWAREGQREAGPTRFCSRSTVHRAFRPTDMHEVLGAQARRDPGGGHVGAALRAPPRRRRRGAFLGARRGRSRPATGGAGDDASAGERGPRRLEVPRLAGEIVCLRHYDHAKRGLDAVDLVDHEQLALRLKVLTGNGRRCAR